MKKKSSFNQTIKQLFFTISKNIQNLRQTEKVDSLKSFQDVVAALPELLLRYVFHIPVLLQNVHPG